MKVRDIIRKLDEQIGDLACPSYQFVNPTNVVFRFNDRFMAARVKTELSQLMSAQVTPLTITVGKDKGNDRIFTVTIVWKDLSDPYSEQIKNEIRFLITKYKMIQE